MAMVNPILSPPPVIAAATAPPSMKDSRWLTLEVCREYQRNKCSRSELECKFAHPPPHVEVQNGRVTCCFDSIKGKCQRNEPPCKYLHPPQHLREQLLQNGRNNLIMKNFQMQAMVAGGGMPVMPNVFPAMMYETNPGKAVPYQSAMISGHYPAFVAPPYMLPPSNPTGYSHYINAPTLASVPGMMPPVEGTIPGVAAAGGTSPMMGMIQSSIMMPPKVPRADRLEVCREFQRGACGRAPDECRFAHPPDGVAVDSAANCVTVCMDCVKGRCVRDPCRYYHPPAHLQAQIKASAAAASAHIRSTTTTNTMLPSQSLPQVVEVVTGVSKKRPREPADDLILGMSTVPMMPMVKRTAVADSKSGIPMYQPSASSAAYQQAALAMQLQQQPFVPVTMAGHPPGVPRF